jgi:hypothetical protein
MGPVLLVTMGLVSMALEAWLGAVETSL